jgi:hypothetical protein
MFLPTNSPYSIQYRSLITKKAILSLSKQRIIQKNLVHFQGFPDSIYDKTILLSPEYFGQYGKIIKIALVTKEDANSKKKSNSAYLTFETKEQAAYCILSVDSIRINNHLVRAFFGTTKYCNHFLNGYHCFNEEKCMFLHHFAEVSDIINETTNFGYSDHIKLAKKIIGFGSIQSKCYTMNNCYKNKTILPNISKIYYKEEISPIIENKNNNHRREKSDSSSNSTENNSTNRSNNRTISYSPSKKDNNKNDSCEIINYENTCNNNNEDSFNNKYEKKSRFFNNNINNNNKLKINVSKNIPYIIDNLFKRNLFFNKFKKYEQFPSLKKLEIEYCIGLYKKTKDNDIKLLLENQF